MNNIKRLILFNQVTGAMFRELSDHLSKEFKDGCLLFTGQLDTPSNDLKTSNLEIVKSPLYNRKNNLTRAISWIKYILFSSHLILFSKKTDAFLVTTNPPLMGIWLYFFNLVKRRPYFLLVYDIYPEVLVVNKIFSQSNIIIRFWNWLNKKVYKRANAVITLNSSMSIALSERNKIPQSYFDVIPPWVDTEKMKPIPLAENHLIRSFNPQKKHIVLYSGNMGLNHDIDSILEAALKLNDYSNILFIFIGGGDKYQSIVDFKIKNQLKNIDIYPYQPEIDLPYILALSSICIASVNLGSEKLMIPSKTFSYMASGTAIIGICDSCSELSNIIKENNCGECIQPNHPEQLVSAIQKIINNKDKLALYKKQSRLAAVKYYSKNIGLKKFDAIIKKQDFL